MSAFVPPFLVGIKKSNQLDEHKIDSALLPRLHRSFRSKPYDNRISIKLKNASSLLGLVLGDKLLFFCVFLYSYFVRCAPGVYNNKYYSRETIYSTCDRTLHYYTLILLKSKEKTRKWSESVYFLSER